MRPIPHTVLQASAGTGKTHQVTTLLQSLLLKTKYPAADTDLSGLAAGAIFDPSATAAPKCADVLMLTFARNAAAEMRERITGAIEQSLSEAAPEDQPRYWDLLRSLAGADISTIHSFAQRLLASHALLVGLTPSFTVMDEEQSADLCREVAEAALLDALAPGQASAEPLAALCQRHRVATLVNEIVAFIKRSRTLGCGLDRGSVSGLAPAPEWPARTELGALAARIARAASGGGATIQKFSQLMTDALAGLPESLSEAQMYAVAVAVLSEGGKRKWGEAFEALEKETRGTLTQITVCAAAPRLQALLAVAVEAAQKFETAKRAQGALDFDDLLAKALDLVTAHGEVVAHYRIVIVDESQDNSTVQNRLIQEICRKAGIPLVICGDPKQSIHTWRGAAADSMRSLAEGLGALTVPLQVSRRSQKGLVEVINRLSRSAGVFGGAYTETDELKPSGAAEKTRGPNMEILFPDWEYKGDLSEKLPAAEKKTTEAEAKEKGKAKKKEATPPPYRFEAKLSVIREAWPDDEILGVAGTASDASKKEVRRSLEARAVARRIYLLCSAAAGDAWRPPWMWNPENGEWVERSGRSYRYSDIAILLRTSTPQPGFEEALRELGIPFTTGGKGKGFFFRQEVADLASVLIWLALPRDDTSFLTVIRSPLVGLSDPALAALSQGREGGGPGVENIRRAFWAGDGEAPAIRDRLPEEDGPVFEAGRRLLRGLRQMAGRASCVDILRHAILETGYDALLAGSFHGAQKLANMRKLLSLVQDQERRESLDLSSLALWLRESLNAVEDPDAVVFDPSENAVRICTVHSAKGLTFPVVFLAGLGMTTQSDTSLLRMASAGPGIFNLAVTVKMPGETADDEFPVEMESRRAAAPGDGADPRDPADEMRTAEAKRLFYVAITRPRDLLVCSGETSGLKASWRSALNEFLKAEVEAGAGVETRIGPRSYREIETAFKTFHVKEKDRTPVAEKVLAAAEASVARPGPREYHRLTVTMLAHVPVRGEGESDEIFEKRRLEYRQSRLVGLAPAWMRRRQAEEELEAEPRDPAETGTRAHAILEALDFGGAIESQVESFLRREGEAGAEAEAEKARICAVAREVAGRLKGATRIIREMPFAAGFVHDGATLMIDGKIDLLYRKDGTWHLVDYKFTEDSPKELQENYALQLQVYLHAISEAAGGEKRKPRFGGEGEAGPAPFRLHVLASRKDGRVAAIDIGGAADEAAFLQRLVNAARMTRPAVSG